jgi:predicted metal-dependent hydrolase
MLAPPEIVDYIIVHELAHLLEANHSDSFWSLVAEHDPEYEAHSQWLEENSTQLIFSEDDL